MDIAYTPQPLFSAAVSRYEGDALPARSMLGLDVVDADVAATLDWLGWRMARKHPTHVAFLNAHCANVARSNPAYQQALARADAVLPDGSGIALAARMKGVSLAANLNGTDLVPLLCARMARSGQAVYLLGGRPGVALAAGEALKLAHPGLVVAGAQHGYFGPEAERGVIDDINASGADLLLVALGVPEQDLWLQRVAPVLATPVTMGVGALFDFLANRVPRAPAALRRAGLEWIYRLYQEPQRMWRRYLLGNFAFLLHAVLDAWPRSPSTGKRALDVTVSAALLALTLPLLVFAAFAVRVTSPGPVLFKQTRIGKNGRPFTMYKIRSMHDGASAKQDVLAGDNHHGEDGVTFKLKRDPRITPVGGFLRRSSIDELPQLWNVLKGDMSLVGPRPPTPNEVEQYTPASWRRLGGLPGLTCLWQVSGRADLSFDRQVELDVEYLGKQSLLTDLRILIQTIPAVLTARGAY